MAEKEDVKNVDEAKKAELEKETKQPEQKAPKPETKLAETADSKEKEEKAAETADSKEKEEKTAVAGEDTPAIDGQKKKNMILRTLLLAILVVAAAFAIKHHMLTKEFNTALSKKESRDYETAITKFEALSEKAYGEIKKRATEELLTCYIESGNSQKAIEKLEKMSTDKSISKHDLAQYYITVGDAPSNNAAVTKKFYQKAYELDPEILSHTQRKLIDPSYELPKVPEVKEEVVEELKATAKKAEASAEKIKKDVIQVIPTGKK